MPAGPRVARSLTRDQLLDHAWPYGVVRHAQRPVDAYVHYLRDKLGAVAGERIRTVRGVGYRVVA